MTTLSASQRRHRLASLLEKQAIRNQDELRDELSRAGIDTTQATISRDLRSLGVLKGPDGYRMPGRPSPAEPSRLEAAVRDELQDVSLGRAVVVLRTAVGRASALAVELDAAGLRDVVGTIAGDDTIFAVTKSVDAGQRLMKRLRSMAEVA